LVKTEEKISDPGKKNQSISRGGRGREKPALGEGLGGKNFLRPVIRAWVGIVWRGAAHCWERRGERGCKKKAGKKRHFLEKCRGNRQDKGNEKPGTGNTLKEGSERSKNKRGVNSEVAKMGRGDGLSGWWEGVREKKFWGGGAMGVKQLRKKRPMGGGVAPEAKSGGIRPYKTDVT